MMISGGMFKDITKNHRLFSIKNLKNTKSLNPTWHGVLDLLHDTEGGFEDPLSNSAKNDGTVLPFGKHV